MALAPVSNVLTRSEITDPDQRLALVLAEPRLADMPEIQLKNVLRYVFMVCGIRGQNIPTGDEKEFLHLYIRKFYGNHTGGEVRQAFDMAIQNRLEVDPRTFENFSTEYFARIMNAFRKWAAVEVRKIENQQLPPAPTAKQLAQIDREYREYMIVLACEKRDKIDKLPSTLKNLNEWKREHSKTK